MLNGGMLVNISVLSCIIVIMLIPLSLKLGLRYLE